MWTVVDINVITPHYKDVGNYINSMEKSGWSLKFVDNGNLFFKREESK